MILVGLDDTDIIDHPGTNQLARHLVRSLTEDFHGLRIVRHQLFFDPRIPYTSKNGSASIWLEPRGTMMISELIERLTKLIVEWVPAGSDPGLCLAEQVPSTIVEFARRCEREVVCQEEARRLAASHGIFLAGLGGTEQGVIGALAAVGLASTGASGRVIHLAPSRHDLYEVTGRMQVESLADYGIEVTCDARSHESVRQGQVDVGKRLRPNLRNGQIVLYVEPASDPWCEGPCWQAVKVDV